MHAESKPAASRWPPQIQYILGNEAAERFSFYGVKAILALYITNVLLMTKDDATQIIHLFGFLNYFTPLLGAWVFDQYSPDMLWLGCAVLGGVLALSYLALSAPARRRLSRS